MPQIIHDNDNDNDNDDSDVLCSFQKVRWHHFEVSEVEGDEASVLGPG